MWITQTYIGNVEPQANIFIYYLYENYVADQKLVQHKLEGMGDAYNDKVSLLMPNPQYADRIESEVREIPALWNHVKPNLPGLLVTRVPLIKISALTKNCLFFPLTTDESLNKVAETISEVRKATEDVLFDISRKNEAGALEKFQRLGNCIQLKPGIFGFSIDLKKLFFG